MSYERHERVAYELLDLLLRVRQVETPVSSMKVAVHRRSLRLPGYGSVVWPDSLSEWLVDGAGLQ